MSQEAPTKQKPTNIDKPQSINKDKEASNQVLLRMERSAPLPDPNEMKGYQEIDPNFPKQIITMAEKEQHFRHISTYIGMIIFPAIVTIGLGISAYTAINGAEVTGSIIAGAVGYIIYVFKSKDPKPPTNKDDKET